VDGRLKAFSGLRREHQLTVQQLMKTERHNEGGERIAARGASYRSGLCTACAFTLIEVMITMGLMMILVGGSLSALMFLGRSSSRMSDYTAAMAAVHGRMEAVRAASYNPPAYPFQNTDLTLTNKISVALDKSGTNYLLSGTIITVISPKASGHLVTVTGTFPARGLPVTISVQSLVNRFSGGQP
jgi:type II secretory pathway pseudopilin PulG